MPVTIAVNAMTIGSAPSGGRTYLLNLVAELAELAGDSYRFVVLATPPVVRQFQARINASNVTYAAFPDWLAGPAFRVAFEQFYLPGWLWRQRVTLLFAARNTMPLLAPCPTVIGVLSMHLNYENQRLPWWRRIYGPNILRASARRARAFVSISEYAGQTYIEKYGVQRERLYPAPLGYTLPAPSADTMPTAPLPTKYLLFVSTLFPHKNVALLLRALPLVLQSEPALKLVIIGRDPGGELARLQQLAATLGISDHVVFCGAVSDAELGRWYRQARVFLFPSLTEGFGLTVLEAMAHGRPVIASNRTSIPEVVGEDGILLDPTDERAWAEAIIGLLRHPAEAEQLGRRAAARARSFTWQRTAAITLNCFKEVLKREAEKRRPSV